MIKFLLDSGDPNEYEEISNLLAGRGSQLWGSTTNPSLIAKKIASEGKKLSQKDAFALQKQIVLQIINLVPGAVSGEVYSNHNTKAEDMAEQGREISSWHSRVVVKLPTTIEGFKARTILRKENIGINNTLVFSQQQIFAICLHEKLMIATYGPAHTGYPAFISPFLGRLDDKGIHGLDLLANGMKIKNDYFDTKQTWMLAASIRSTYHLKATIDLNSELITAPAKIYTAWSGLSEDQKKQVTNPNPGLMPIPEWKPTGELLEISTIDAFMQKIDSGELDIHHELTTAGIDKFVADWQSILS